MKRLQVRGCRKNLIVADCQTDFTPERRLTRPVNRGLAELDGIREENIITVDNEGSGGSLGKRKARMIEFSSNKKHAIKKSSRALRRALDDRRGRPAPAARELARQPEVVRSGSQDARPRRQAVQRAMAQPPESEHQEVRLVGPGAVDPLLGMSLLTQEPQDHGFSPKDACD